jgi:hypothetical protein
LGKGKQLLNQGKPSRRTQSFSVREGVVQHQKRSREHRAKPSASASEILLQEMEKDMTALGWDQLARKIIATSNGGEKLSEDVFRSFVRRCPWDVATDMIQSFRPDLFDSSREYISRAISRGMVTHV